MPVEAESLGGDGRATHLEEFGHRGEDQWDHHALCSGDIEFHAVEQFLVLTTGSKQPVELVGDVENKGSGGVGRTGGPSDHLLYQRILARQVGRGVGERAVAVAHPVGDVVGGALRDARDDCELHELQEDVAYVRPAPP